MNKENKQECPNCKKTTLVRSQLKALSYKKKSREDEQWCCPLGCGFMFLWAGNQKSSPRIDPRWADHRYLYSVLLTKGPIPSEQDRDLFRRKNFPLLSKANFERSFKFALTLLPKRTEKTINPAQNILFS